MKLAFKPKGTRLVREPNGRVVDVDAWIAEALATHQWTGWFCYDGPERGVVLWNSTRVGWLMHGVASWPSSQPAEILPASATDVGHAFAYWSGPIDVLPSIESLLDGMGVRVYLGRKRPPPRRWKLF